VSAGRALITGVSGQDGSYLADLLVGEGWDVTGTVRPPVGHPPPNLRALAGRLRLVAADLGARGALGAAIRAAEPDRVYHLAAPSFVPASWEDPAATIDAITTATAEVVGAAGDVGARVLVASSPEIFAGAGESPQTERSPRRPLNPYGVAKLAAHALTEMVRERRHLHACLVIPYNHESPRRPAGFVSRRISLGVAAIHAGRADELVLGDLEARRDWSHARDIVRGMHLALSASEPGDYVLGSGVPRTVREFAETAFACAGLDPQGRIRVDPALVRSPQPTLLAADAARARAVLGWAPETSFEALVAEMVASDLRDGR
jgi:GDPmannose 4,6-dehydratase